MVETGEIEEEVEVIAGAVVVEVEVVVAVGTGVAEKMAGVAEMREGEEEDDTEAEVAVAAVAAVAGVVMEVREEVHRDKMSLESLQLVRDNHMTKARFQVFIDRILGLLNRN